MSKGEKSKVLFVLKHVKEFHLLSVVSCDYSSIYSSHMYILHVPVYVLARAKAPLSISAALHRAKIHVLSL